MTNIKVDDILDNLQLLGGSFSKVKIPQTEKEYAVKIIAGEFLNVSENLSKGESYLSAIKHENIIGFYQAIIEDKSSLYLVMEYADCGSLHDALHDDKGQFSFLARQNWMLQCAKGVEYLHDLKPKVIHRALNTSNLLLTNNYRTLKIANLSAVKEFTFEMTMGAKADVFKALKAPEIFAAENSEWSDVYSFGVCLWETMKEKSAKHVLAREGGLQLNGLKGWKHVDIIRRLIQQCWDQEPRRRPTMKMVSLLLGLGLDSMP